MRNLAIYAYRLTLALWVGGVVMYTLLVTPAIFRDFGRDTAAKIVDSMMGGYFTYNLTVALVATALLFMLKHALGPRAFRLSLILGVLSIFTCLYIDYILYPGIMAVKATVTSFETMPKDVGPRAEFGRLHALSAGLNLSYLIMGAVMLYMSGKCSEERV